MVGKFIRPRRSTTGAFSASASSTISFTPSWLRATRSQTMSGFCAAPSSFAASRTAPDSPCGGADSLSLGIASDFSSSIASSCSMPSATISTGSIGGVIAIL